MGHRVCVMAGLGACDATIRQTYASLRSGLPSPPRANPSPGPGIPAAPRDREKTGKKALVRT